MNADQYVEIDENSEVAVLVAYTVITPCSRTTMAGPAEAADGATYGKERVNQKDCQGRDVLMC